MVTRTLSAFLLVALLGLVATKVVGQGPTRTSTQSHFVDWCRLATNNSQGVSFLVSPVLLNDEDLRSPLPNGKPRIVVSLRETQWAPSAFSLDDSREDKVSVDVVLSENPHALPLVSARSTLGGRATNHSLRRKGQLDNAKILVAPAPSIPSPYDGDNFTIDIAPQKGIPGLLLSADYYLRIRIPAAALACELPPPNTSLANAANNSTTVNVDENGKPASVSNLVMESSTTNGAVVEGDPPGTTYLYVRIRASQQHELSEQQTAFEFMASAALLGGLLFSPMASTAMAGVTDVQMLSLMGHMACTNEVDRSVVASTLRYLAPFYYEPTAFDVVLTNLCVSVGLLLVHGVIVYVLRLTKARRNLRFRRRQGADSGPEEREKKKKKTRSKKGKDRKLPRGKVRREYGDDEEGEQPLNPGEEESSSSSSGDESGGSTPSDQSENDTDGEEEDEDAQALSLGRWLYAAGVARFPSVLLLPLLLLYLGIVWGSFQLILSHAFPDNIWGRSEGSIFVGGHPVPKTKWPTFAPYLLAACGLLYALVFPIALHLYLLRTKRRVRHLAGVCSRSADPGFAANTTAELAAMSPIIPFPELGDHPRHSGQFGFQKYGELVKFPERKRKTQEEEPTNDGRSDEVVEEPSQWKRFFLPSGSWKPTVFRRMYAGVAGQLKPNYHNYSSIGFDPTRPMPVSLQESQDPYGAFSAANRQQSLQSMSTMQSKSKYGYGDATALEEPATHGYLKLAAAPYGQLFGVGLLIALDTVFLQDQDNCWIQHVILTIYFFLMAVVVGALSPYNIPLANVASGFSYLVLGLISVAASTNTDVLARELHHSLSVLHASFTALRVIHVLIAAYYEAKNLRPSLEQELDPIYLHRRTEELDRRMGRTPLESQGHHHYHTHGNAVTDLPKTHQVVTVAAALVRQTQENRELEEPLVPAAFTARRWARHAGEEVEDTDLLAKKRSEAHQFSSSPGGNRPLDIKNRGANGNDDDDDEDEVPHNLQRRPTLLQEVGADEDVNASSPLHHYRLPDVRRRDESHAMNLSPIHQTASMMSPLERFPGGGAVVLSSPSSAGSLSPPSARVAPSGYNHPQTAGAEELRRKERERAITNAVENFDLADIQRVHSVVGDPSALYDPLATRVGGTTPDRTGLKSAIRSPRHGPIMEQQQQHQPSPRGLELLSPKNVSFREPVRPNDSLLSLLPPALSSGSSNPLSPRDPFADIEMYAASTNSSADYEMKEMPIPKRKPSANISDPFAGFEDSDNEGQEERSGGRSWNFARPPPIQIPRRVSSVALIRAGDTKAAGSGSGGGTRGGTAVQLSPPSVRSFARDPFEGIATDDLLPLPTLVVPSPSASSRRYAGDPLDFL